MAAKTAPADVLRNGAAVRSLVDLWPNVVAGTPGKVVMSNGLTWIRYWVLFENGQRVGLIDRKKLATPPEWERRQSGAADPGQAGQDADAPVEAAAGGEGGNSTGGVPEYLLERSRKARERMGAKT